MTGRTIVITSGKGGVGKTTATANIGTGLAMRGHRVVVVDTDIGLRNLDVVMGLENRIVYDLVNVIEGTCKLHQAMIHDKHKYELYLIPAAQTRDKTSIGPEQLRELCRKLEQEFDYVLMDCPAGIEQGFKNAIAAAREAIIVTTPEVSAIRDADRVIGLLEASELHRPRLIISRGLGISEASNRPMTRSASRMAATSGVVTMMASVAAATAFLKPCSMPAGQSIST